MTVEKDNLGNNRRVTTTWSTPCLCTHGILYSMNPQPQIVFKRSSWSYCIVYSYFIVVFLKLRERFTLNLSLCRVSAWAVIWSFRSHPYRGMGVIFHFPRSPASPCKGLEGPWGSADCFADHTMARKKWMFLAQFKPPRHPRPLHRLAEVKNLDKSLVLVLLSLPLKGTCRPLHKQGVVSFLFE